MSTTASHTLERLCVNTLRLLSADAVQHANSGHPGMPMGAAAMAFTLWTRFLKHNPADPDWFDRDRFVLSAGHGSVLLYSLLHLTGYAVTLDDLKRFRRLGSKTPGHPERGHTPGVEVATGPLGQGFGNGVGMAIAEAWLAARYNRPGHDIIDHYTYAICADGDLMEGIAQEAASLAGHLRLGKIVYLYDQNRISLAGGTDLTFTESVAKRFEACRWHTRTVEDGNDSAGIADAIAEARSEPDRPSLILVRTHIGFGSPKQDHFSAHGSPLGEDELLAAKEALGWPTSDKFHLPKEAVDHFRTALLKGAKAQQDWMRRLEAYRKAFPAEAAELESVLAGKLPPGWNTALPGWGPSDKPIATRVAGGIVLNALASRIPNLVGGSADLNPSTNTALKGMGDFQSPRTGGPHVLGAVGADWSYAGRNLAFGVREHAMAAAVNGMAAHGGLLPFCATFLVFSDYMKPSIRLAALSGLRAVFVFTHDSIAVGEDGPTHEPVEQLAGLRAIPGLTVIRPADATETAEAWAFAVAHPGPTLLALTRQAVPHLDRGNAIEPALARGAYILSEAEAGKPDAILIGTGSEVSVCMQAQAALLGAGIRARVVSMPSWSLFEAQSEAYRERVLPKAVPIRIAVEAGSTLGWHRWVGDHGGVLGMDRFGASAPGEELMRNFGFTPDRLVSAVVEMMGASPGKT